MPGPNSPKVTRGRITIPARGFGRTFMFNPNEIGDAKGISFGSMEVPGASHPVYQFGAGGERLISFDLNIDGDRGRYGRETNGRDLTSLSITDELLFYRSLIYPSQYGNDIAQVFPYTVLFTFGELYSSMPCIVKKADWKVNYWTPKLQPVRATINIALAEIVTKSQTSNDVLTGIPNGGFLGNVLGGPGFVKGQ